jgi:hypothetical protein
MFVSGNPEPGALYLRSLALGAPEG